MKVNKEFDDWYFKNMTLPDDEISEKIKNTLRDTYDYQTKQVKFCFKQLAKAIKESIFK